MGSQWDKGAAPWGRTGPARGWNTQSPHSSSLEAAGRAELAGPLRQIYVPQPAVPVPSRPSPVPLGPFSSPLCIGWGVEISVSQLLTSHGGAPKESSAQGCAFSSLPQGRSRLPAYGTSFSPHHRASPRFTSPMDPGEPGQGHGPCWLLQEAQ